MGNPLTGIKFRKKADDYEDLEEQIKKKRQEIQEMGNKPDDVSQGSDEDEDKISPEKEI